KIYTGGEHGDADGATEDGGTSFNPIFQDSSVLMNEDGNSNFMWMHQGSTINNHSNRTTKTSNFFHPREELHQPIQELSEFERQKKRALQDYERIFAGSSGPKHDHNATVRRYTMKTWGPDRDLSFLTSAMANARKREQEEYEEEFDRKVGWEEFRPIESEAEIFDISNKGDISPLAKQTMEDLKLEKKRRRGELFLQEQMEKEKLIETQKREKYYDSLQKEVDRVERVFDVKELEKELLAKQQLSTRMRNRKLANSSSPQKLMSLNSFRKSTSSMSLSSSKTLDLSQTMSVSPRMKNYALKKKLESQRLAKANANSPVKKKKQDLSFFSER
ncbi:unnamed protein product, partial [Amoebophrya sp. A120]